MTFVAHLGVTLAIPEMRCRKDWRSAGIGRWHDQSCLIRVVDDGFQPRADADAFPCTVRLRREGIDKRQQWQGSYE